MLFHEVIGQDAVKEQLRSVLNTGRVSHAWLFAGATGYGSLALALATAQYLLCTGEKGSESCGVCPACKKVEKLIHPDLHFVFPVVKNAKKGNNTPLSDDFLPEWRQHVIASPYFSLTEWQASMGAGENAKPSIYTRESEEIIRKLSLKPFESDYKIMVIWLPEMMENECANKLLKMLEEPYPKTFFFLVSEEPERLLPTILSRTQRMQIPPISNEALSKVILSSNKEVNAAELVHLSRGNYHTTRKLLAPNNSEELYQSWFIKMMRLCWKRSMVEVNLFIKEMNEAGREQQKRFLAYALRFFRECYIRHSGHPELVYLSCDEESFAKNFAPYVRDENILTLNNEFERAYADIARNGNGQIIFTDLAISVIRAIRPNK